MKCENCGYVANAGDRICLNCGARLPEANAIIKGLETIKSDDFKKEKKTNKLIYITIGGIIFLAVIIFIVIKVFVLKK